ncbi:MFS transporter [Actinosynnema sp. NPDC050436]|uniref:MFS transporter n=1 Tax=Actinosynnema sp. NPDC050436 TaxID=3155659 RepID=UPI0034091487
MTTEGVVRRRRERLALWAATLGNGPTELVDFVLPLWAGLALGLGATEVGVLTAVEMAVSVLVRPVAGVLADRCERRGVAAVGALLYAVSCAGYAVAGSASVAYAAAAIGGAGGALLWVALRAVASERLEEDSGVFPRLLAAEETGSWVAFVAGLALLGVIGFAGVFWLCAAACLLAAGCLLAAPRRPAPVGAAVSGGLGAVGRRLRPMLFAVAMTMAAEAAVSLLLLLHLQRGFGLEVVQIAYVFLPGAIAMSVAAGYLHRYVVRFGRSRVLMTASLGSCAFAVGLAWAPNPYVVAGLWVLSGLAWAAVMPVQQAVVAEASGDRVGRGMGVYESACLVGALVGSLVAGVLYDGANWVVACLVAGGMILAGAVVVPRAVRRLGVAEYPPPAVADTPSTPGPAASGAEVGSAALPQAQVGSAASPRVEAEPAASPREDAVPGGKVRTKAELWRGLATNAALFAVTQAALAFADLSWVRDLLTRDLGAVLLGQVPREGVAAFAYGAGRVWAIVLLVDLVWTVYKVRRTRAPG